MTFEYEQPQSRTRGISAAMFRLKAVQSAVRVFIWQEINTSAQHETERFQLAEYDAVNNIIITSRQQVVSGRPAVVE